MERNIPKAEINSESIFGIDKNINVETIDKWLGRDDAVYRDSRMLIDPANFSAIGLNSILHGTVKGFEVVPYPYLGTITGLPEPVASTQYDGPTLFTLTWDKEGKIDSIVSNYKESEMIISDLYPKDKAIFLMCGAGGYAGFTKALLLKLGYNPDLVFNIGGFADYNGENTLHVTVKSDDNEYNAFHRLNYHLIDFKQLHKK